MRNYVRTHAALAAACCALLAACDGGGQPPRPAGPSRAQPAAGDEAARDTVLRLEREWALALARKDLAWYDRHVAPEFRTILSSGRILPRAAVVEHVRNSPPARDVRLEQAEVRLYGEVALATVTQSFAKADGSPGRLRMTDLWSRSSGDRWMVVHSHETSLPPGQQ